MNELWDQITTATWVSEFLGTMAGVAIGALVALLAVNKQLKHDRRIFEAQAKHDRDMFEESLRVERGNAELASRRALCQELAAELTPAAARLDGFVEIDLTARAWPDHDLAVAAVRRYRIRFYVAGLQALWEDALAVVDLVALDWARADRLRESHRRANPSEFDDDDLRLRKAMIAGLLMTGRASLSSLVTTLAGSDGSLHVRFPTNTFHDERNEVEAHIEAVMLSPLGPLSVVQAEERYRAGKISAEEFEAEVKRYLDGREGSADN